ncbi:MAG: cytochrome b/b6 domain-containing protein [Thiohalobacterales bacterium]|nr:cytochrome b/b6 domain-containing protein [Thiohalobacterales bacterium]
MTKNTVRVWDPLVRLFHWTLVAAFIIAYVTGEEENMVHIYAGYYILGLLVFRVVWGFTGTRYARFSNFIYSPRRTVQYLKGMVAGKPEHFTGHNPAGGWMIVMLLVSLSLTTWTGLEYYGLEGHGPLAAVSIEITPVAPAHADDDEYEEHEGHGEEHSPEEEFWEELHEITANLTVLLIVVHVAGVVVASRQHGENLVRSMITGDKSAP